MTYKRSRTLREYLQSLKASDPVLVQQTSRAVVCDDIPIPPIDDGEIVGFRYWGLDDFGRLLSGTRDYCWKVFNVADEVPSESNSNGLYAHRITPFILMSGTLCSVGGICGLVSLSGRVVEHMDGVLRAECAKVKCIWYVCPLIHCPERESEVCREVGLLVNNYPTVPLYVCTQRGVAGVLTMLAMRELMLERES